MSLTDKINKAGYCAICDTAVYEAASYYPTGHPWQGRMHCVLKPLENCRWVHIALANTSITTITVCERCIKSPSWSLPDIHEMLVKSWQWEMTDEFRKRAGAKLLKPKQKAAQEKWLKTQIDNIPLAIIGVTCNG